MRILWLTPEVPFPSDNGHRVVYGNRILQMAALGHEIHLRAFAENDDELLHFDSRLNACSASVKLFCRRSSSLPAISKWTPRHVSKRWTEEMQSEVKNLLQSSNFDALIIDSTNMAQYFNPSELPTGAISVLNVHNLDYRIYWRSARTRNRVVKRKEYAIEGLKTWAYERRLYSQRPFDLFAFLSKNELQTIVNRHNRIRTVLTPIGVVDNAGRIANIERMFKKVPTIAFIGNLSYFSNIEGIRWFVETIYPKILFYIPDTILLIAGKNPTQEIMQLASGSGQIKILPNVSDTTCIIGQADIVVAPIISGAGVKVKILEALSCKKLVVATDLALEGTDFDPGVHLLSARRTRPAEFARKCVDALEDASMRNTIASTGYEYVISKLSWPIVVQSYNDILIRLLANKRRSIKK